MSRLKNKSVKLSQEELFLRQQARERAFLEEQSKSGDDKDSDKFIQIIREEEKENVRHEVLNEQSDIILQIQQKALELELMEEEKLRREIAEKKALDNNALGNFAAELNNQSDGHKIILLTDRAIKKQEGRELEKHFKILKFDPKANVPIQTLDFDLYIIPMKNKAGRQFWAKEVNFVQNDENYSVVYLSKRGKKIPDPEVIKKQFHCQYVRKNLPSKQPNKFLYMLELFTDHISKLSNSCLPIIKIFLKN